MLRTLKALLRDDNGFVLSAELILIMTIGVLAMIVGLSEVAVAVNTELNDISNAIGKIDQSYAYTGFCSGGKYQKLLSWFAGSSYKDKVDDGDTNESCDLVCGASQVQGESGSGW